MTVLVNDDNGDADRRQRNVFVKRGRKLQVSELESWADELVYLQDDDEDTMNKGENVFD